MKISCLPYFAAAFTLAASSTALFSGCAVDSSPSDPIASPSAEEGTDENGMEEVRSPVVDCSTAGCGNCVKHARCLKPSLPTGLFSCDNKKEIINASTPTVGSVAIMDVGSYCHVGYVWKIEGSGSSAIIWLDEGNYTAGTCTTTRHGTAAALEIVGYFD